MDQGYADRNLIAKWKKVCLSSHCKIFGILISSFIVLSVYCSEGEVYDNQIEKVLRVSYHARDVYGDNVVFM